MLRDYQSTLKQQIFESWRDDNRDVLAVMPCGAGKTVVMASVADTLGQPSIALAHRAELVAQISLTFARGGMRHRIIAPKATVAAVEAYHFESFGKSLIDQDGRFAVASVDALLRRADDPFLKRLALWQMDEAHHVLPDNKWGKIVDIVRAAAGPRVRGLGWTGTPSRTDGRSLCARSGGVWGSLVCGPSMRELIDVGHLCDYELYGLPQSVDVSGVSISGGDYNRAQIGARAKSSAIVGDVVAHYLRLAAGLAGVTFACSVEMAVDHAKAFRDAGVPAAVLSAKTADTERASIIRAYRNGELLQVCNVDVLGEGFDLPAIRVVSLARPTISFPLYVQQFCRGLRPSDGKRLGLILDHAGNARRHGLPDRPLTWRLEGAPLRETVRVTICGRPTCARAYESYEPACPYCGWDEPPEAGKSARGTPETLDGDLTRYTPEMLAQLRMEAARIASVTPLNAAHLTGIAALGAAKAWEKRRAAQAELADVIDAWGGQFLATHGDSFRALYRRFYAIYGIDTLSALTQSGPEMIRMAEKIKKDLRNV